MPKTLYCRCAYAQVIPEDQKNAHLEKLCTAGEPFDAVPDLCELAANRDPKMAELAATEDLHIIACHPRAVQGLFRQTGNPLPDSTKITNMRDSDA
ncbi:MAG: hypothetical protein P8J87_17080 [Verrucomicrobiales bacterium]|nr:hypothetical protein [Verrucomicrobiales bacterium]